VTVHKKRTAYHEAGHAVIARVLTLPAGKATIKADHAEGSAGHTITPDPYECLSEWDKRGKQRGPNAVWRARIMAYMAGAEAEIVCLGSCNGGDGDDRYQISRMLAECRNEPSQHEARLRALTRSLVRRHKASIERVARALIARTALSRRELNKLVGRSVDDVKPNSPFLLLLLP
jgi:hypothetical protein